MNSSEVREKGGVGAGVRWSLVMGLFGELRSGPVFVQRSEPGVEDQAGADGDRHQTGQRAYGLVQVAGYRRDMQGEGFGLC